MGNLLIKGIVIIGIVLLASPLYAAECQRLSDAELEMVSAGKFLDFELMEEMIRDMVGNMVGQITDLASASTLINVEKEVDSTTSVLAKLNCSGEVITISYGGGSNEVINQVTSPTNVLTLSDSTQASLNALVNINSVASANVVQTNFNYDVDSATNINTATVINTH